MILSNDLDANNMQLLKARAENVTALPTGLGMDDKGRLVMLGSGLYMWVGWRWVAFADNKYYFKPSNQILAKDDTWYDDPSIQFQIGALELYEFKLIVDVKFSPDLDTLSYWMKFVASTTINEMRGSKDILGWADIDSSADHWHDMLTELNVTIPGLVAGDHYIFNYDGIIYGGSETSTIKLQHKATGATGIIDVRPFTRIILTRIY